LVFAVFLLAACDPPETAAPEGVAAEKVLATAAPLPAAVDATVRQLQQIAESGGYRELAQLANATPDFRSNNAGLSHRDYWSLKERTGDFPAEQVGRVLAYPYAVADSPQGKIYIWPALAMLKPEEITPAAVRDIDQLLGEGQAEELRKGAIWSGYVLGIREDGRWLYFVSGSG
jgi:hypothetical protein